MTHHSFVVPAISWAEISSLVADLRSMLDLESVVLFPVMDVLEFALDGKNSFAFEVGEPEEMGGAEGLTCPDGTFIRLDEEVYLGALRGNGRDRFTAAHEIGHLFLHSSLGLSFERAPTDKKLESFRLSEPQANFFAAELLMPKKFISSADHEQSIVRRFGVSKTAARNRLSYMKKKGLIK